MIRRHFLLALAATALATAAPAQKIVLGPSTSGWWHTTLVRNVNGIQASADGRLQHFNALAFDNRTGKVIQVFVSGERLPPRVAEAVDGGGRTLLPGMIDAHGHITELGFAALQLDLVGASSLPALQQRLRAYAAAHPEARWIIGRGWNQELWPDKRF